MVGGSGKLRSNGVRPKWDFWSGHLSCLGHFHHRYLAVL